LLRWERAVHLEQYYCRLVLNYVGTGSKTCKRWGRKPYGKARLSNLDPGGCKYCIREAIFTVREAESTRTICRLPPQELAS
jgi:hypothetical protein